MLITKEIHLHMGHRIPNHKSKCRNLHGHTYRIEVGVNDKIVSQEGSSDEGMVIDFADLKVIMLETIYDVFDHGFVLFDKDELFETFNTLKKVNEQKVIFVSFIPTVENLSRHWFELLDPELREVGINLQHVKAWESPTSTAIYTKEDNDGK